MRISSFAPYSLGLTLPLYTPTKKTYNYLILLYVLPLITSLTCLSLIAFTSFVICSIKHSSLASLRIFLTCYADSLLGCASLIRK